MNRLLMALALYLGLGFFFAINAIAILNGASMLTAVSKGVVALALFAILGMIAGMVARVKPAVAEVKRESGDTAGVREG